MKVYVLFLVLFCNFNAWSYDDQTLFLAIDSDNLRQVRKIVEGEKLDVNLMIKAEPYRKAPLISLAGRSASLNVLNYLISKGADLDLLTDVGESALMLASFFPDVLGDPNSGYARHLKAVQLLLNNGAKTDVSVGFFSALGYAAYQGHDKIMKLLINAGADLNSGVIGGIAEVNTPLMMSSLAGSLKGTLLLLDNGADAKIENSRGDTALSFAKKNNKSDMIPYLECAIKLLPGEEFKKKCR